MGLAEADDTERSAAGWCNWGEMNGWVPKPSFCMGGGVKEVNASHLLGWHHVTAGALLRRFEIASCGDSQQCRGLQFRLGVAAKVGIVAKIAEAWIDTKSSEDPTACAGKAQRWERRLDMNRHREQCRFGQQVGHPKDVKCRSSMKKER
jgi:hypothetical protein